MRARRQAQRHLRAVEAVVRCTAGNAGAAGNAGNAGAVGNALHEQPVGETRRGALDQEHAVWRVTSSGVRVDGRPDGLARRRGVCRHEELQLRHGERCSAQRREGESHVRHAELAPADALEARGVAPDVALLAVEHRPGDTVGAALQHPGGGLHLPVRREGVGGQRVRGAQQPAPARPHGLCDVGHHPVRGLSGVDQASRGRGGVRGEDPVGGKGGNRIGGGGSQLGIKANGSIGEVERTVDNHSDVDSSIIQLLEIAGSKNKHDFFSSSREKGWAGGRPGTVRRKAPAKQVASVDEDRKGRVHLHRQGINRISSIVDYDCLAKIAHIALEGREGAVLAPVRNRCLPVLPVLNLVSKKPNTLVREQNTNIGGLTSSILHCRDCTLNMRRSATSILRQRFSKQLMGVLLVG